MGQSFGLRFMSFYKNQKILLATKHQKEKVIAPIFKKILGAEIIVPQDFDTDQFGTFSFELPRELNGYQTAVKKAKTAAEDYGVKLVVASEGSFGPHPDYFWMSSDIEIMVFLDLDRSLEISEYVISTETNHDELWINRDYKKFPEYKNFLEKIAFPSHGLIIHGSLNQDQNKSKDSQDIFLSKGIYDFKFLEQQISLGFDQYGYETLCLKTDMRAMLNTSRMKVIGKLAEKLAQRINCLCQKCENPGFGKLSSSGYLSCESCDQASFLYKYQVQSCIACDHKILLPRPDGLIKAPMSHCQFCNP